ncbi:MAG: LysR family transcriptional regulator [Thiolinea sp.]
MLDELRQIAIFAKTVDHGSFRAAAQALNLSPSVISHHVGQLEQRLDTALLYRSTRKLSLTPDGERLLAAAHAMIDAAEAGLQDIVSHTHQPSGTLRVTAPAFLAQSNLTSQFAEFSLAYPQVELVIDFSDTRKALIADGYDVALRAGIMEDSSLMMRKLFDVQRRLVASPAYLATHAQPPVSPSDLSEWDWLLLAPVKRQKLLFRNGTKKKLLTKLTSRMVVNNVHALCQLAKHGVGLTLIPAFIAEEAVNNGDLQYVLPEWAVDSFAVSAVWPSNAPKYGLVKHFINFIADQNKTET